MSSKTKAKKAPAAKTRADTKIATMGRMIRRGKGASVEELSKALHWQPHTVRAAVSRARRAGKLKAGSFFDERRGLVYQSASK